jgi:hypothetical protein
VEHRDPGWFVRLVAPQGGGRPATLTFVLGALAAGAFIGSLALDWQSVTVPAGIPDGFAEQGDRSVAGGIASIETLSLVYTLGVVALLGVVGAVVTRPDLALRQRMAATGVTVGLVGVLAAVTLRLSETVANLPAVYFIDVGALDGLTYSYEPGLLCGYAAVVLSGAAIWRAGGVARRRAADAEAAGAGGAGAGGAGDEASARVPTGVRPARRESGPGEQDGRLVVSFSDPLDLSVGPGDAWQSHR